MSTGLATSGCQPVPPAPPPAADEYAEPIAIQLPAARGLPAVTIVLAFNRGATVDGLVQPVGSAVYKALKACPVAIDHIRRGEDALAGFSVARGRILPETPPIDDDAASCLAAALATDTVPTPPGMKLKVRARVLTPEARGVGSP